MNNETNESNENNLKNENEKLKLALAQSNHATRKLEEEIQTFKNNNSRLSNALQEGHLTSEDLKKQLQFYKEECTRLRSTNTSKIMTNSNNDLNDSFSKSLTLNTSNPKFKQELSRLTDSFDKKLNELNEIRQQLKNLLNDIQ